MAKGIQSRTDRQTNIFRPSRSAESRKGWRPIYRHRHVEREKRNTGCKCILAYRGEDGCGMCEHKAEENSQTGRANE